MMKRSFGLLGVVGTIVRQLGKRLVAEIRSKSVSDNIRVKAENPQVGFPPCDISFSAYNHCDYRRYLETGFEHAKFVMETIRKVLPGRDLAICEWGVGPARIIQHLQALDERITRLVGTDCDKLTIDWCRETFPQIEFLSHSMNPPLQLASGSLDVVYCCAVFTHLDEPLHHAWINEILRLLRPGGLLIASFHGDRLEDRMNSAELKSYRSGKLVVRPEGREGERSFVSFAGDIFVRDQLLNRFENITRLDDAPFLQTVWSATAPGV